MVAIQPILSEYNTRVVCSSYVYVIKEVIKKLFDVGGILMLSVVQTSVHTFTNSLWCLVIFQVSNKHADITDYSTSSCNI